MDVLAPGIGGIIGGSMAERGTDREHCAPTLLSPASGRAVRGNENDCKLIVPHNRTSLSSRLQEPLSALQGGEGGTREAGG